MWLHSALVFGGLWDTASPVPRIARRWYDTLSWLLHSTITYRNTMAAGLINMHCGSADGRSGPAMRAACSARRWLVRSAAGVKRIRNWALALAPTCTSLVFSLPALEGVDLEVFGPVVREDLGCLLEVLAWCPRLRALKLNMGGTCDGSEGYDDLCVPFPAPALAALSSLTWLDLCFDYVDHYSLADVVGALVSMTALAGLHLGFPRRAVVPAALGQLKGLRSLKLSGIRRCVLEAGCLDLPNLRSLAFAECKFRDAEVLPGVSALQRLTCIDFNGRKGVRFFDPRLVRLPELQCLVLSRLYPPYIPWIHGDPPGLLRLPAHMGSLSVTLLRLDISGNEVNPFPLALTQLVALEHLDASKNELVELPAGITTLSRLTELVLGRAIVEEDPLQLHGGRPLDVRAMGDMSGVPALRKLTLAFCEVVLCPSVLGAARHASLASLCFNFSHPAHKCTPAVLQLSQELWRLRRSSVLRVVSEHRFGLFSGILRAAQGRAPLQKFMADLEACRLEASGQ